MGDVSLCGALVFAENPGATWSRGHYGDSGFVGVTRRSTLMNLGRW
jgi:hypothetical protein